MRENRDKVNLITDFRELGLNNAKQLEFVNDYIFSNNIAQSGISVGYSEKYARSTLCRLLAKTSVKTYIEQKQTELYEILESEKIASKKELLELLTSTARNEQTEEVVIVTEAGADKITKDTNIKDRTKAIELLGKHHGLWQENINVNANQKVEIIDDI